MFNFKMALLNIFFKFEVLSDLPGRMRLKVNNFKRIPKEALNYQSYAIEAINRLDGIKNVKVNDVIGTILIEYDYSKLSSREIIDWINSVKNLVTQNMDVINSLEGKSELEAKEILFSILDDFMEHR